VLSGVRIGCLNLVAGFQVSYGLRLPIAHEHRRVGGEAVARGLVDILRILALCQSRRKVVACLPKLAEVWQVAAGEHGSSFITDPLTSIPIY
jgi:hypothetical protein